ncbi:MAG: phosphatidate cytidylyltransferase [Gammaproteobacteria bacterium]|nr:phosphatidate cytidylyltransferase [Gammaproteobacteria bacterium]MCP5135315.1 phosphatidate cytidylyltransferase [Gammaproteobacteria bacterium]
MLKTRIITALILAPLVVMALLYLPPIPLGLVFAVVVLIAAWEWVGLLNAEPQEARLLRWLYPLLIAIAMVLAVMKALPIVVISFGAAFWVWGVSWLAFPDFGRDRNAANILIKATAGVAVLVPTWIALLALHGAPNNGPWLVLYAIAIAWVADTGAYFAGRRFGRVKLAPRISPGKTREGAYGAFILVAIYGGFGGWAFGERGEGLLLFVLVTMLAAVASIVGDLFESLFKRHAGIKDSSQLIPGHGGVLDRIDSLTAALPVFAFGIAFL